MYINVVGISVQHVHWRGYFGIVPISYPALFHRALPCNIGESSVGKLLLSLTSMVIKTFGAFFHLEKHLQRLFGLFYEFWGVFIMSCLGSGG